MLRRDGYAHDEALHTVCARNSRDGWPARMCRRAALDLYTPRTEDTSRIL